MIKENTQSKQVGAAVVLGGGIGGMQAALDLADSGIKVYLVESSSAIGGRMAQLDKTFPTNECAMCVVSPKLVDCDRHLNIEIITNTEIESVEGEAGNFKVTLHKKARYVDMDKCTGCEECSKVCPVVMPSKFNSQIGSQRAIYRLYPQAVPNTSVIDKDHRAPCVITCPAHINVQGYIALISQGKYKEAFDLIKQRVPLPGVLGRVCYHPCEETCNRKDIESPLAINPLKRFVADFVYEHKTSEAFPEDAKKDRPYSFDQDIPDEIMKIRKSNKVAVIGSGPCGLTAAFDLARCGYNVTIFEANEQLGGMMRFGIPSYRLPKELLDLEINNILSSGIEVKTKMALGKDFALSDLTKEGYKAVFIATGSGKSKGLPIPGVETDGVWHGLDFLRKVNLNEDINMKGKVLVIGGGNVAIDVARSAVRKGATEVHMACLESRNQMPAHQWEIELAQQEGITIHPSLGPVEILGNNNKTSGVKFVKCASVFDEAGRFNPVFNKEEESTLQADVVMIAIGQQPDTLYLDGEKEIEKTGFGGIKADALTCETTKDGIFAGGEVAVGAASVIQAIASGKEAAISVDRYILGEDIKSDRVPANNSAQTPEFKYEKWERASVSVLPPEERKNNFAEVEITLDENEVISEAKRCMNCGICSECRECEKVCEPHAIDHAMKDERIKIDAGAVIISSGVDSFDANVKKEYGYSHYENVITSVQFERILSSSGPTSGDLLRPSDAKHPKKIAFIQCVGSRDESCGNEFCSSVCCMYSIKEAVIAKEHDPGVEPTIFYIDIRSFGKDFERYYENAKNDRGVKFVRCMISKIYESPKSKNLMVKYIDGAGRMQEDEFDLVVLAVGLTDTKKFQILSQKLGIETNEYGFCKTQRDAPGRTSREGIFVAGINSEPKDIPETVAEGSSAAALVSALLEDARGTLVKKKEYPPERDVSEEETRIGVFICRCGRNIASVVDVEKVVEYASKLQDVAYATEFLYSCSKDALDTIKQKVTEHNLNRVVVASCTPRTHEELFRDTVRETGLNKYLFEMTSLREQVSWVHKDDPKAATEKSKELVAMMVAKTRLVKPLSSKLADVTTRALVVGGGAAGMQAALTVAQQGFEAYIIEKEDSLGGHLRELFYNPGQEDVQGFLKNLIEEINTHEKIHVMANSEVKDISGFVGNYSSVINCQGEEKEIKHGTVILASGAKSYEPKSGEYGFGQTQNILTQVKLEEQLVKAPQDFSKPQTIVMIQCVGSRNDEHPYCSRICCTHAIKNALKLKEINPGHKIIVLYRDIRTYGFLEKYYLKARESGVVFSCFEKDKEPQVNVKANQINIDHTDAFLHEQITFKPDRLILSAGIVPGGNEKLAKIFKVPLTMDGFFLEAHAKIRPLDFTTEGMFVCGLAHSPRFLHESLSQAQGTSVRAATILSKDKISAKAIVATVNERVCRGCGICVSVCPYGAREIDEETNTAKVIEVLCQGCGACAVACPSGATTHKGFTKKQILAMVEQAS